MGMNYFAKCLKCNKLHEIAEFSIVSFTQLKNPDEAEENLISLFNFLTIHSGHKIKILDSRNNETIPSKITGAYVLGLEEKHE